MANIKEIISLIVPTQNITIIFEPLTSILEIDEELKKDVYTVFDIRLYDLAEMNNQITYQSYIFENMQKAIGSGKPIIYFSYYPPIALSLNVLNDLWKEDGFEYKMKFIAFFHNDEQTEKLDHLDGIDDMIELKKMIESSMEEFPFIKKAIIPVGQIIDREFLKKIMED